MMRLEDILELRKVSENRLKEQKYIPINNKFIMESKQFLKNRVRKR